MSVTTLKPGKPIILRLLLEDGADDKYVRAFLTKNTGVVVAGSPFSLSHVSNGLYTYSDLSGLLFPDDGTKEIYAVYKTFDDSLYTTESTIHFRALDVYQSSEEAGAGGTTPPDVDPTGGVPSLNVIGIVQNVEIIGHAESSPSVIGSVDLYDIVGIVQGTASVNGTADIDNIIGIVGYVPD